MPIGYDLNAVWGDTSSNVWAVGDYGVIVHWDGNSVFRVDSPTKAILYAIDAWAPDDIFAAGGSDLLHYDGWAWDVVDRFPGDTILDVLCDDDGRLYIVGTMGVQCREGERWQPIAGPTAMSFTIWRGPDGRIRVGDNSWLWLVEDGVAVAEQEFPDRLVRHGDGSYVCVEDFTGHDYVYRYVIDNGWTEEIDVVTSLQSLLDCDGVFWSINAGIVLDRNIVWWNDTGRWIHGLARCGGDILACGYGGTLMLGRRSAGEVTWKESAQELGFRDLNAFSGANCGDIWAAEWHGRVLHYDGSDWTQEDSSLPIGDRVAGIQSLEDGWVVALGGGEIALRRPDGGWSRLPSPGGGISVFHALAPDSIFAATITDIHLWNKEVWTSVGSIEGQVMGFASGMSDSVYALIGGEDSSLHVWDGAAFRLVTVLPDMHGQKLCASRTTAALWIGGYTSQPNYRTVVYRYTAGGYQDMTTAILLPPYLTAMTELRPDDLFILTRNQIWRCRDGAWSREQGLPVDEDFTTMWSCPEGGLLVEGHPTFYKDFSRE